ncbi:DNA helicase [Tanacetum coccineum]
MTSLGAHIDESINNGRGPYVFKISGQLYHWIGSLCPAEGEPPRFLQLYIYDTDNEVDNRMSHFGGNNSTLRRDIVEGLIDMLDTHNALVQLFRTAREKYEDIHIPNFKVRLYNVVGAREYATFLGRLLGAIVYEPGPESDMDYDIVLEERSGYPQRVNKLHPSYMSLQFPLLFIYGQDGYSKELRMIGTTGSSSEQKRLTMKAYYSYYLHDCIYDAINQGDNDGSNCGAKLILPQSFVGGPRADIVDRVFEMKIHQFIHYLRDAQPFGKTVAVLYTVEFQKRGLPHCHTLLWIDESVRVRRDEDIDIYISQILLEAPDRFFLHRTIQRYRVPYMPGHVSFGAAGSDREMGNHCSESIRLLDTYMEEYVGRISRIHLPLSLDFPTCKFRLPLPPEHLLSVLRKIFCGGEMLRPAILAKEWTACLQPLNGQTTHIFSLIHTCCLKHKQVLVFVYGTVDSKTFLCRSIPFTPLRCEGRLVLAVASLRKIHNWDPSEETCLIIWDAIPYDDAVVSKL